MSGEKYKIEKDETYPGLYHITGFSFRIAFWTTATDITFEQSMQRMADAKLLVETMNGAAQ